MDGNLSARDPAVVAPPQIIGQPAQQIVEPGHAATFSVVIGDAHGATFQWNFNGGAIAGATGDSLRRSNVTPADEGAYTVTVTNASGSVTSAPAMLWIDSDGDGLPDTWEIANFGNLAQTALGDFDGDGVSNLDEFRQGTNPASNTSFRVRLSVQTFGGGTVAVSPAREFYNPGDVVTLTAVPTPPYSFDRWTDDLATTENPATLTFTFSGNKSVTALFSYLTPPPGLLAWWRGETDASDLVGGHHGAFYSGPNPVGPAVTAAGLVGGAFSFDGTVHVRVPDAADLRPALFFGRGLGVSHGAKRESADDRRPRLVHGHAGSVEPGRGERSSQVHHRAPRPWHGCARLQRVPAAEPVDAPGGDLRRLRKAHLHQRPAGRGEQPLPTHRL